MNSQDVLRTMLIHTCEIDQIARSTANGSSLGHQRILPNNTPTQTWTGIQGRLEPVSAMEQQTQGSLGQVISDYSYYVINRDLVETLRNNPTAVVYFRMKNVYNVRDGNVLVHAGPFDINGVLDEAGEAHHWKIMLRRVA